MNNNIDLSEKLKMLEAEVEAEIKKKNEEDARIWQEFTGQPLKTEESLNPYKEAAAHTDKTAADMMSEEIMTKDNFNDSGKWVMALAGGGGKGSYQLGVWKALREIGVEDHLCAVSGSSVGALNAALISTGNYEKAENIWLNILPEQFLDISGETITGPLDTLVNRVKSDGICSRNGFINILNTQVDMNTLANPVIDAYACISWYSSDCIECLNEKPVAEYIRLCEVDATDAKSILLASSAMPYIYPAEVIHGKVYRDGGLSDNLPIKPLTGLGADRLISVKLDPDSKADTSLYSSFKEVIEIVPSREIGGLIDGTLDFHKQNVLFRMLLGYYDTLRAFSLRMYAINGVPLSEAEINRRIEADFERVLSEVSRRKALTSAQTHMTQLDELLKKLQF